MYFWLYILIPLQTAFIIPLQNTTLHIFSGYTCTATTSFGATTSAFHPNANHNTKMAVTQKYGVTSGDSLEAADAWVAGDSSDAEEGALLHVEPSIIVGQEEDNGADGRWSGSDSEPEDADVEFDVPPAGDAERVLKGTKRNADGEEPSAKPAKSQPKESSRPGKRIRRELSTEEHLRSLGGCFFYLST